MHESAVPESLTAAGARKAPAATSPAPASTPEEVIPMRKGAVWTHH